MQLQADVSRADCLTCLLTAQAFWWKVSLPTTPTLPTCCQLFQLSKIACLQSDDTDNSWARRWTAQLQPSEDAAHAGTRTTFGQTVHSIQHVTLTLHVTLLHEHHISQSSIR